VKEAVGKALGTGIGNIRWQDIEIINDERGRPELILHNAAAEISEANALNEWSISMSHTETHAVGVAVAMGHV
jgi:holo-[acyl-carrier protein] synthase